MQGYRWLLVMAVVVGLGAAGWVRSAIRPRATGSVRAASDPIYLPLGLRGFAGDFPAAPTVVLTATPAASPVPSETPTPSETPPPSDTPTLAPSPTATPSPTPKLPAWQARVNYHRALARLGPVTENPEWSHGDELHSRYVVKEQPLNLHEERPSSPWFTQAGLDAAINGNVYAATNVDGRAEEAVDAWMTGPFHQTAILDPQLQVSGYGEYREEMEFPKISFAATLDKDRGRTGVSPTTRFPVRYPDEGMELPALSYDGNEWPDPLTSCPGYAASDPTKTRTGPPLVLILGAGDVTPKVTRTAFTDEAGAALAHCTFDQTNYKNPDSSLQRIGRGGLEMRSAVIVMPKAPLKPGARYTLTIVNSGATHTWSFRAGAGAGRP